MHRSLAEIDIPHLIQQCGDEILTYENHGNIIRFVLKQIEYRCLMRIVMLGTGYVALYPALVFQTLAIKFVCVDKDTDKISRLQRGEIPIFEPGLTQLVEKNCRDGRLHFTTSLSEAVKDADAVFYCGWYTFTPRRWSCRFELCLCRC